MVRSIGRCFTIVLVSVVFAGTGGCAPDSGVESQLSGDGTTMTPMQTSGVTGGAGMASPIAPPAGESVPVATSVPPAAGAPAAGTEQPPPAAATPTPPAPAAPAPVPAAPSTPSPPSVPAPQNAPEEMMQPQDPFAGLRGLLGGEAIGADAFCTKYEMHCGFDGTARHADFDACLSYYEAHADQQWCFNMHLDNAIAGTAAACNGEASPFCFAIHCPHATGIDYCM